MTKAVSRDFCLKCILTLLMILSLVVASFVVLSFNPLALLRLGVACDPLGEPSRFVCETVFRHVWRSEGAAPDDVARLAELTAHLSPHRSPDAPEVKAQLKAHTDAAIETGVFGVPTFDVDGHLFWGLDALPMLRAYVDGDAWFDGPWVTAASVAQGVKR